MRSFATLAIAAIAGLASTVAIAQPTGPRSSGEARRPADTRPPRPPTAQPPVVPPPIVRPPIHRPPGVIPPPVVRPPFVYRPRPPVPLWVPSLPYASHYHDVCTRKAWRLRWFERRASYDGYISPRERAEMSALRRDLRRTCGDWRWNY